MSFTRRIATDEEPMECFHPLGTFSPLCRERRMADTEEKNMRVV
jgi:hypothetical protein